MEEERHIKKPPQIFKSGAEGVCSSRVGIDLSRLRLPEAELYRYNGACNGEDVPLTESSPKRKAKSIIPAISRISKPIAIKAPAA